MNKGLRERISEIVSLKGINDSIQSGISMEDKLLALIAEEQKSLLEFVRDGIIQGDVESRKAMNEQLNKYLDQLKAHLTTGGGGKDEK